MGLITTNQPAHASISTEYVSHKRSATLAVLDDKTAEIKKICLDKECKAIFDTSHLDSLQYMATFLNDRDLLHFEATCKAAVSVTKKAWECADHAINRVELSDRMLYFKWSYTRESSHKWNYCLTKALDFYIDDLYTYQRTLELDMGTPADVAYDRQLLRRNRLTATYQRFRGLGKCMPLFKKFVKLSLNCVIGSFTRTSHDLLVAELSTAAIQGDNGACALLGLCKYLPTSKLNPHISTLPVSDDSEMKIVMEKGAAWYSLLVIKIVGCDPNNTLAAKAIALTAATYGYYQALEHLIERYGVRDWEPQLIYPPILARRAKTAQLASNNQLADQLYTQAIAAYGTKAPLITLQQALYVKQVLQNWQGMVELYTQSIAHHGAAAIPPALLSWTGYAFSVLKRYDEAFVFYTKAMAHYGDAISGEWLACAAHTRLQVDQNELAADLYAKALEKLGNQVDDATSLNAASANMKVATANIQLKHFAIAADYAMRALAIRGDNASSHLLINTANINAKAARFEVAADLYTKAFGKYGYETVSVQSLWEAAHVYENLKDYKTAADLYAQALLKGPNSISRNLVVDMVCNSLRLEYWEQIPELMALIKPTSALFPQLIEPEKRKCLTKLFSLHQDHMSAEDIAFVAALNQPSEQGRMAKEMIDHAITKAAEGDLVRVWRNAISLNDILGDYAACVSFYDQIMHKMGDQTALTDLVAAAYCNVMVKERAKSLKLYEHILTKDLSGLGCMRLAALAFTSLKLKHYAQAALFCQQALAKDSGDIPIQTFYYGATANIYLGQYDAAEALAVQAFAHWATRRYDAAEALAVQAFAHWATRSQLYMLNAKRKKYAVAAVKRLTKAIKQAGDAVPVVNLHQAAKANLQLENYATAADLYAQVLVRYGDAVPADVAAEAQAVEEQLAAAPG